MQYKILHRIDWIKTSLITTDDYSYTTTWNKYKEKFKCCRATFSKDWILAQQEFYKYANKRELEIMKIDLFYRTGRDLKEYFEVHEKIK